MVEADMLPMSPQKRRKEIAIDKWVELQISWLNYVDCCRPRNPPRVYNIGLRSDFLDVFANLRSGTRRFLSASGSCIPSPPQGQGQLLLEL